VFMDAPYFLRHPRRHRSSSASRIPQPYTMTSAADALAAANAATTAIAATDARIDAIEAGQTAISTQLALIQAGGGGGAAEGGGGGAAGQAPQ
jgi:hypothetical protein